MSASTDETIAGLERLRAALLPHYRTLAEGFAANAGLEGPIAADIAGEFYHLWPHADGKGGMAQLQDRGPRYRGERCFWCGAPNQARAPGREWTCSPACARERREHYS